MLASCAVAACCDAKLAFFSACLPENVATITAINAVANANVRESANRRSCVALACSFLISVCSASWLASRNSASVLLKSS